MDLNPDPRFKASQMTAAEVLDTFSRHPGMDGEANDAVSAYTQVN